MNVTNGQLLQIEELEKLPPGLRGNFVPVTRDLTELERSNAKIEMYSPCGCGSGRKFKFCCHRKDGR